MSVALVGPIRGDIHAIARALARALGAAVFDGDRLQPDRAIEPDVPWMTPLTRLLEQAKGRAHRVVAFGSLCPEERRSLRGLGLTIVRIRDGEPSSGTPDGEEAVRVWVDATEDTEEVATRLYRALLRSTARSVAGTG